MIRNLLVLAVVLLVSSPASADDVHYRNILVGEQAAGLGGAYIAVSDDPSGIYYNPAGIMFSMENYFSLSGNAYVQQSKVFKNVLAGQDYSYTSSGLVPTFFGLTQTYGRSKWGFAVVMPNSMSIDQNDEITGISTVNNNAHTLKRRLFEEDRTYLIGPAFATELKSDLTIGVSLFGVYRTRNRIDNQMILWNGGRYAVEERTMKEDSFGLYPKLGLQYMPAPKYAVGMTVAKTLPISSTRKTEFIEVDSINASNPTTSRTTSEPKLPSPLELGIGGAYFPSKRFLFSADFLYHGGDREYGDRELQPTWNVSVGSEAYVTETAALRLGLYTNNANTLAVSAGKTNQPDHVNLYGATAAIALRSPGSSFTFGTTYSMGNGEGQAIGNNPAVHVIEESRVSFYLTGSYQL